MPDTNLPQVMITMTDTSTIRIADSDVQRDYVLNVLTGLLWSREPICNVAIDALTAIGKEAAPYLLKACAAQTLAPSVLDACAEALSKMAVVDSAVVAALLQLVEEGHSRPHSLLNALARIAPGDQRVLNCLERLALNPHDTRQKPAIDALNIIGSYRALEILERVPQHQSTKDEQLLTRQLQSKSRDERLAALDMLQRILPDGADVFLDLVLSLFEQEPDQEVRKKASRYIACAIPCTSKALSDGLADLMDPGSRIRCAITEVDSLEPIFDWLDRLICSTSTSPTIRYMSARVFRSFGIAGVPYLVKGLSSFSGHPQHIVARELGKMGKNAAAAVPELLRIIRHSRSFPWGGKRSAILDALAQIAPDEQQVIDCLSGIAGNEGDSWHHAAAAAIKTIASDRNLSDSSFSDPVEIQNAENIKQFIGNFHGTLQEQRGTHEIDTMIKLSQTDERKLIGQFVIHTGSYKEYGELTQQGMVQDRKLIMEWSDAHGNGTMEATFSDDLSEFHGRYFLAGDQPVDEKTAESIQRNWTGRRQS